jgi:hypothetical protein
MNAPLFIQLAKNPQKLSGNTHTVSTIYEQFIQHPDFTQISQFVLDKSNRSLAARRQPSPAHPASRSPPLRFPRAVNRQVLASGRLQIGLGPKPPSYGTGQMAAGTGTVPPFAPHIANTMKRVPAKK